MAPSLILRSLCKVISEIFSIMFCTHLMLSCYIYTWLPLSLTLCKGSICKGHLLVNSSLTILIKKWKPWPQTPTLSHCLVLISSISITIICHTICCSSVSCLSSDWNVCFIKASCTLFTAITMAARILPCHRICDESVFIEWINISSFHDWVIPYGIFQVEEHKVYCTIRIVP